MAELEVDQSNLPRVQEVSQYFSVLEDGALAHNLQEQEIEQHYSSNIQRNQLVRKDIRVAKRLQDEEQERAQMLHEQDTRQLEEQDLEYARRIQEEIQRTAEEERRREEKDEEIAKRIQEEEVLYVRQRNSCRRSDARENDSAISSSNTLQRIRRPLSSEEEELAWQSPAHSPSPSTSDYEADHCERRSSFTKEYADNVEQRRQPGRELPLKRPSGQSHSSFASQSSTSGHLLGGWGDVVRLIKNDLSEQGYLDYSSEDELFEPIYKLERMLSKRQQASERRNKQGAKLSHHSSMREESSRMKQGDQAGGYRYSDYKDGESVRPESRQNKSYSYCTSGDGQRHVRFQDDQRRCKVPIDGRRAFVESSGGRQELRSSTLRPCRGNVQVDKRASFGEVNRTSRRKWSNGVKVEERDVCQLGERERWEEGSCRVRAEHRGRAHTLREGGRQEGGTSRRYRGEPSRRRMRSERWQGNPEDRLSTEEEEEVMDRERVTRAPRNSPLSLSASLRGRSPGAGLMTHSVSRPSLDLGELRQVLQDEELACRLQAEEEELLRVDLASASPLESSHSKGDFTVAQVAQDEEIAHFMQKQEVRAQLRSEELEDMGSVYREVSHVYDNTEAYDVQMPRERLNSEGLFSPAECSPERHSPSPVTLETQQHSLRNIAEVLDPTFHRNECVQAEQSFSGACQIQPSPQAGSCEEPGFVAPTKRQNDKVGRTKSKEKKDNPKTKENCKQQ